MKKLSLKAFAVCFILGLLSVQTTSAYEVTYTVSYQAQSKYVKSAEQSQTPALIDGKYTPVAFAADFDDDRIDRHIYQSNDGSITIDRFYMPYNY